MCTVDKPFIIVVEVDNKRAFKAYSKGMNDLMDIWPQLMEAGELVDTAYETEYAAREAQRKAIKEKHDQEHEVYLQKLRDYSKAMDKWNKTNPLFRGNKPEDPTWSERPASIYPELMVLSHPRIKRGRGVAVYKSIRDELQKMLNLAGAASAPYRMMEGQVHVMIEWENGHRIQELLNFIKENK